MAGPKDMTGPKDMAGPKDAAKGMPMPMKPMMPLPGETPPGKLPPPPPSPLVPKLPEVMATQGPAYKTENLTDDVAAAILWILPPKFGLDPAKTYPDLTVKQGALVEVSWAGDPHNVWWTSEAQRCPSRPAVEGVNALKNLIPTRREAKLSDYPDAQKAVTATKGTFYMVCTVDAHCEKGMVLKVNVV